MTTTRDHVSMTAHTITYGGRSWAVTVDERGAYGTSRWNRATRRYEDVKTRLFVSVPNEFDAIATASAPEPTGGMFPDLELHYGNGNVIPDDGHAWTQQGEHPEVDKAWKRHNAALVAGWTAVLKAVLPGVAAKFSRKAGCSCPCSPGFIATDDRGRTFFITVTAAS